MARAFFAALAVADTLLFLYLFLTYGWFNFTFPRINEVAALVVLPVIWGITLLDRVIAASFFAAVGAGIWKGLTGRDWRLWLAMLKTPVLMIVLSVVALVWIVAVRDVASSPPGMIHDRLTLFDALARQLRIGDIEMLGGVSYAGGSYGAFLIILLGVLYLAEKYLVQSWGRQWPVPITPLLAVASLAVIAGGGEWRQRQYVAAQQWRGVGPQVSWIDALVQCEQLGEGWRLPRREELVRYVASQPAEIESWQGHAWTNQIDRNGEWAVAVDLAPRRSGRWNRASEATRDESLCEERRQPGYATDWFAASRDQVCAWTTRSPYLFTPGLRPAAIDRGAAVTLPPGGAVCIRPASDAAFPDYQRRGYDGAEFTSVAAFRDSIADFCRKYPNRAACQAYADR
jgi:hypothetical protein